VPDGFAVRVAGLVLAGLVAGCLDKGPSWPVQVWVPFGELASGGSCSSSDTDAEQDPNPPPPGPIPQSALDPDAACAPDASDNACQACGRRDCCGVELACYKDAACLCLLACAEAGDCTTAERAACGPAGTYDARDACIHGAACAKECPQ
jgi:hypothetical protein